MMSRGCQGALVSAMLSIPLPLRSGYVVGYAAFIHGAILCRMTVLRGARSGCPKNIVGQFTGLLVFGPDEFGG